MSNRTVGKKVRLAGTGMLAAVTITVGVTNTSTIRAQSPPPVATPKFEVAAVKLHDGREGPGTFGPDFGTRREDDRGIQYRGQRLDFLMPRIYKVQTFQVVALPWMATTFYDISATLPAGASVADVPVMLQHLLEDRFHLSVHRELRETDAYDITVAPGGAKLQKCTVVVGDQKYGPPLQTDPQRMPPGVCPPPRAGGRNRVSFMVETNSIDDLASRMKGWVDRPVVNRTNLEGNFNIYIHAATLLDDSRGDDPSGLPSVFSELQRLGLRLERRREKFEYLVVDQADRVPTDN